MNSPASIVPPKSCRRAPLLLAACAIVLILALAACLLFVGSWLTVQDPLQPARAIVVLSGRMPLRALEAARLFRAGYAPQIWLTRPQEPAASMAALGIPYLGEDFFNQQILIHEGVPPEKIFILPTPIDNTADEMRVVAFELAHYGSSTVIVVTTKVHTRRVRILWHRLAAPQDHAIVRAPANDLFDPARWWRSSSDALDVVREVLGILNAWAGLPLRPAAPIPPLTPSFK